MAEQQKRRQPPAQPATDTTILDTTPEKIPFLPNNTSYNVARQQTQPYHPTTTFLAGNYNYYDHQHDLIARRGRSSIELNCLTNNVYARYRLPPTSFSTFVVPEISFSSTPPSLSLALVFSVLSGVPSRWLVYVDNHDCTLSFHSIHIYSYDLLGPKISNTHRLLQEKRMIDLLLIEPAIS